MQKKSWSQLFKKVEEKEIQKRLGRVTAQKKSFLSKVKIKRVLKSWLSDLILDILAVSWCTASRQLIMSMEGLELSLSVGRDIASGLVV